MGKFDIATSLFLISLENFLPDNKFFRILFGPISVVFLKGHLGFSSWHHKEIVSPVIFRKVQKALERNRRK